MQALAGLPLQLQGSAAQKRQYTYVDDVVEHIAKAPFVASSGSVVNLGADEIVTKGEVMDAVTKATGRSVEVRDAVLPGGVHHAQVRAAHSFRSVPYATSKTRD